MIVIANSTTPSPISADECRPPASSHSSAIVLAIVAPGLQHVRADVRALTDHERDRDRLAERTAEAEHRRAPEAAFHLRQHGDADRLPSGRAERERGRAIALRHGGERCTRSDVMIGRIMIASTMPAVMMLTPA